MAGAILYHPDFLLHDTGTHVELPGRLLAIMDTLQHSPLNAIPRLSFDPASDDDLSRVHPLAYVRAIEAVCDAGGGMLDPDTVASPKSAWVARLAAGASVRAVEAVCAGEADWAFALVRPPGHHATRTKAMGFCIFNNIAIAAEAARQRFGVRRPLILDWDVHHGNGTQDIFYEDAGVFYCSVHQWPSYPGTGAAEERGRGAGLGATLNLPLPPGSGDAEYIAALRDRFLPAAEAFQPDLILVSAGFDAHHLDPLAQMEVTTEGFRAMASLAMEAARRTPAKGRLVACLEGGYHPQALGQSVVAVMEAWNTPQAT